MNAWLILALARGIRGRTIEALLGKFEDAEGIVNAPRSDLLSAGLKKTAVDDISDPDPTLLEESANWLTGDGHHLLVWNDPRYPSLLKEIPDPPIVLFVRGNVDLLSLPQIAIVGSRNATPGGCETAHRFAGHLGRSGFCITSGLALGIDAAAHHGALDTAASTIAVLGTGPNVVYPHRHQDLADTIAGNGALISEFPPGTPPRREQFPQRNRIISGIAVGTLVVEAGIRSGALITARFSAEQGREVFAIPGSIHNPMAKGCHQLIKSGAKLVETAADIVDELSGILAGIVQSVEQNNAVLTHDSGDRPDPEYRHLLAMMGWDPVNIDTLITRSGLTAEVVSSMLLILELEGRVEPLAGGQYQQREEGRSI